MSAVSAEFFLRFDLQGGLIESVTLPGGQEPPAEVAGCAGRPLAEWLTLDGPDSLSKVIDEWLGFGVGPPGLTGRFGPPGGPVRAVTAHLVPIPPGGLAALAPPGGGGPPLVLVDHEWAVFITDCQTRRVVDCNGRAESAVGVARADLIGRRVAGPASDEPNEDDMIAKTTDRETTSTLGLAGGRPQFRLHAFPPAGPGRDPDPSSLFDQVASERDSLQGRLAEAARLEQLGVLAGVIAHDFKNCLAAILGFADLARMGQGRAGGPQADLIGQIAQTAQRAADMCRQLLEYSGPANQTEGPVCVSGVARDMERMLRVSVGRNVTLGLELGDDLPRVLLPASPLRQAIMNLVINASEAIGEGTGAVDVRTGSAFLTSDQLRGLRFGEGRAAGEYVFLEVADNGVGMDEATRARIFDPFFTTKPEGNGLGLALLMNLVRAHGGAMGLRTAPGAGTTFRLYWPAARPETSVEDSVVGVLTEPIAAPKGTEILVVDDESAVREVLVRMLEVNGARAWPATNGADAVRLLRADPGAFGCVFMDWVMPGLTGVDLLAEVRRAAPGVPVVVMSGYGAGDINLPEGERAGLNFLDKPFVWQDVAQALQAAGVTF